MLLNASMTGYLGNPKANKKASMIIHGPLYLPVPGTVPQQLALILTIASTVFTTAIHGIAIVLVIVEILAIPRTDPRNYILATSRYLCYESIHSQLIFWGGFGYYA